MTQMPADSVTIVFPNASAAEGNQLASSLADALCDADSEVSVERRRERADTQDFGTTLAVILGTRAITAVARGIAAWLARNSGAVIEIRRNGSVVLLARHLDSEDAARIAAALEREP